MKDVHQVLDGNCQQVSDAVVEVWYAGGDPGLLELSTRI